MNTLLSFSFSSMLNLHFFLAVRNGQSQTPGKKNTGPSKQALCTSQFSGIFKPPGIILSWESWLPPPKATPPRNKALLRVY